MPANPPPEHGRGREDLAEYCGRGQVSTAFAEMDTDASGTVDELEFIAFFESLK
jgi:hypothetical protein